MDIKLNGTKIGAALGFIPVVSSVVGLIKYVNYTKLAKRDLQTAEAFAVKNVQNAAFPVMQKERAKCEKSLARISLVEMIPGVNIIAAFVEVYFVHKLNILQKTDPWQKRFDVEPLKDKDQDKKFHTSLIFLDRVDMPIEEKRAMAQQLKGWYHSSNPIEHDEKKVLKLLLEKRLKEVETNLDQIRAKINTLQDDANKAEPKPTTVAIDGGEDMEIMSGGEPPIVKAGRERQLRQLMEQQASLLNLQAKLEFELANPSTL